MSELTNDKKIELILRKFHGFSREQWDEELCSTWPYSELPTLVEIVWEQASEEPVVPLADKHKGMRVSCSGVLGRIRDGWKVERGMRYMCGVMLTHLEEMATRFYAGDLTAVDEFLQLYDLDEKRPKDTAEDKL